MFQMGIIVQSQGEKLRHILFETQTRKDSSMYTARIDKDKEKKKKRIKLEFG